MIRETLLLVLSAMTCGASLAAERAITLTPVHSGSWEFLTNVEQVRPRPTLGVGYWQRASGAKPGVGANYVSVMEFQLPEAAPVRVRSATFQFNGRQSQCSGAEPVVIDVYVYGADGKGEVGDASAGTRVAQMSADCRENPAFARPIDVTHAVRQMSVPAGIRYIGFNVRKANNRQGPGLFALSGGKVTVVLADPEIARRPGNDPQAMQRPGAAPIHPGGSRVGPAVATK